LTGQLTQLTQKYWVHQSIAFVSDSHSLRNPSLKLIATSFLNTPEV